MAKRKRQVPSEDDDCPCGRHEAYQACCRLLHDDEQPARTAEDVMRARYSAHVFDRPDYLEQSWHPDTRPPTLAMSDRSERWLGLEVGEKTLGGALDAEGFVTFTARFNSGSVERVLTERSRFVRLSGRWVYYDGELDF